MSQITFGLRIPPCVSAVEVGACIRAAEEAGFDIAWIPDSQFLWRDVWATMAVGATMSERIVIGSCVTNFETRHPSVTASAASTVEELAPNRVILGVGTGDSSIKTLGLAPTRLAPMREQIQLVRDLLAGESVPFNGRTMRLRGARGVPLPVYMAATGPKALQLAGEVADGVIILAGFAPELIDKSVTEITEGAARAGRRIEEIDICLGTFCHVTSDEREAARIVKPYVVATAQIGGSEALNSIGIDIEVPKVVDGIYPDMSHAEDWDRAADVAGQWVTDDMALRYADAFCLVGSPDSCIERLRRAAEAGISNFYIRHFSSYTLPKELLRSFGEDVIPAFAADPLSSGAR